MNHDLTTEHGVVSLMRSSNSEREWNVNFDMVKRENNGYPEFWHKAIISAGVLAELKGDWLYKSLMEEAHEA